MGMGRGCSNFLRFCLKFTNVVLVVVGLAELGYSLFMLRAFHEKSFEPGSPPPAPNATNAAAATTGSEHVDQPWFIFAFGSAGGFTTLTAMTGLVGAHNASKACLSCYTLEMFVMLFAQAALAIAFFADTKLQKYIPPDNTGNEEEMEAFVKKYQKIVQWFAVAVLGVQLVSVLLAYALKRGAEEGGYDSDDEEWEGAARRPLNRCVRCSPRVLWGFGRGEGSHHASCATG
mmetsp:Transcript_4201/g.13328  ORF Transcript_4201/g.13328 Transcript_4201/m.13328 type:complete len:231 (+) Transcript_4201:204-896(+)